jgi:hypothetical protein
LAADEMCPDVAGAPIEKNFVPFRLQRNLPESAILKWRYSGKPELRFQARQ